ncbi:MAG: 50S ribosomal protein L25 [Anaerolineales bacterium]|nr:50S ribosomal protein L25 [Anaerolineales bacterium]
MAEKIVLKASNRKLIGKKVKLLRQEGKLPAVLYGKEVGSISIALDLRDASKVLRGASSSTLVVVDVDGKEYTTLVRERQRDVLRDYYTHIDFQAVSLTETVRASVAIILEGDSPAIDTYGALVVSGIDSLDVEALPQDLPENITVDVSSLGEIGDTLYVKDLVLPKEITVMTDPEELLVVISAPQMEEEEEEVEEGEELFGEMEEPEVIEKGKQDEDEE